MRLEKFVALTGLYKIRKIVDQVELLSFYFAETKDLEKITTTDVKSWFKELNLSEPNVTRLKNDIRKSSSFVWNNGHFYLNGERRSDLRKKYPQVSATTEEIFCDGELLPLLLYEDAWDYIKVICDQINASYENNIFDGCAVLMRRLIEVLLILYYKYIGIEDKIKDGNSNYLPLEKIIDNATTNNKLDLSRDTKNQLDNFRKLGNFSAHKITYFCRRWYIDEVKLDFRAIVEELLDKSGVK